MVMQFLWKLSHRRRTVKIGRVATLAQVMQQMKKNIEKIARNSMSRIFCDKIVDFVTREAALLFFFTCIHNSTVDSVVCF